MAPSGDDVVLLHTWNQSKQSFLGTVDLPGGIRMLAEDRFLARDSYIWLLTFQDQHGTILSRTEGKERRVA